MMMMRRREERWVLPLISDINFSQDKLEKHHEKTLQKDLTARSQSETTNSCEFSIIISEYLGWHPTHSITTLHLILSMVRFRNE